jgi:hypothetical protein
MKWSDEDGETSQAADGISDHRRVIATAVPGFAIGGSAQVQVAP